MGTEEMEITPQDIIDKEFRVKFRGFDMAEVDTFLEEVAESFLKLIEENTLLNEKILALQQNLKSAGSTPPLVQHEIPAELGNLLEELKQDTTTMSAELAALKLDRQTFDSLREKLDKAVVSVEKSVAVITSQPQIDFPADLSITLAAFKHGTETIGAELAALKQEVGAISGIREEIKKELQEQLSSHFEGIDTKLSTVSDRTVPAAPKPKAAAPAPEKLLAAEIIEEPEGQEEESRIPAYQEEDIEDSEVDGLEFLSEDDILDVDKLRGIFQSVLDEDVTNGHDSREGDDASADLLFLEDDFGEDEHEPEVNISLDENETAKPASGK